MSNKLINFIATAVTAFLCYSCGKKTTETKPIRKDVTETVFAAGVLEAKNTYNLTALADGYLMQVNFKEGDIVSIGKLLAVVANQETRVNQQSAADLYNIAQSNTQANAPALLQAQNTININKQKMELDLINYERYKKLWANNSIAKLDVETAELQYNTSKTNHQASVETYKQLLQQANQQLISSRATKNINALISEKNQVKAVIAGKVFKKYKETGDYVKKGEIIALMGYADSIYAKVNIDEANINRVKVGQEAFVQLNTNKERVYKAIVNEIYPSFDEASQSFICKLVFTDTLDFKIINTQLQSNIVVATNKDAMLIPRNYLDFGGNVQVKGKKGKVKVTTKFVSNDWVQVLSGIDANTILVTENISANKTTTSDAGAQMQQ
jgi:HlyD family secretion protein